MNETKAPQALITDIHTDTNGLQAAYITLPVDGVAVPAYYARPEHGQNLPVVLVVCEIFGLHEYLTDICRRLAKAGYLAISPELFLRQGDPKAYGQDFQALFTQLVSKVPDAQLLKDLDASAAWAMANGGDPDKLGVTGFCWGGRATWLYAAHNPALKAAVAWYGRLHGAVDALHPRHPLDVAADLRAPVLGLYGGRDGGIPQDTIEQMQAKLASGSEAARQSRFIVYPEAGHAFHADYRPSYMESAARAGWQEMLGWFRQHGLA